MKKKQNYPTYLNGKSWAEITRDERTFCFDLIYQLNKKNKVESFVRNLNTEYKLGITKFDYVEGAAEVSFYRDMIFRDELESESRFKDKVSIKNFLKRTFDICFFLPKDIIIIEAKAAEGLTSNQLKDFDYDIEATKTIINNEGVKVHLLYLLSDEYLKSKRKSLQDNLDKNNYINIAIKKAFSWEEIKRKQFFDEYELPLPLKTIYSDKKKLKGKIKNSIISKLNDISKKIQNDKLKE